MEKIEKQVLIVYEYLESNKGHHIVFGDAFVPLLTTYMTCLYAFERKYSSVVLHWNC